MANVPYSFVVGSLMYAMVCTRPDIAHAVGLTALEGFTDAVMAGDLDNHKSTSSYLFKFERGGGIYWQSKLQKCVSLSKIEAEYASVEAYLSKNMMYHSRTKHIDVRYHWLRDVIEEGLMKLDKVHISSETRPPMLENGMCDSWKTRIILYIQGKENGEMLKDSIEHGPNKFKSEITIKDTYGVTDIRRAQILEDLGDGKLRYDSDIKSVTYFISMCR
ncbi:hypothetical protein Tco_0931857 [Tanacetum coccineum]